MERLRFCGYSEATRQGGVLGVAAGDYTSEIWLAEVLRAGRRLGFDLTSRVLLRGEPIFVRPLASQSAVMADLETPAVAVPSQPISDRGRPGPSSRQQAATLSQA